MEIKMPRGDLRYFKFPIKNKDKSMFEYDVKDIFITFKRNFNTEEILFQKRFSNGDITLTEDKFYHFRILPEDTENLDYGEYVFDIEVVSDKPEIKQTKVGTFIITDEATFARNEV